MDKITNINFENDLLRDFYTIVYDLFSDNSFDEKDVQENANAVLCGFCLLQKCKEEYNLSIDNLTDITEEILAEGLSYKDLKDYISLDQYLKQIEFILSDYDGYKSLKRNLEIMANRAKLFKLNKDYGF